jgi:hypothetical protein
MLESSFPRICFDLHFRADRRIAEQMIACLYALPRTEPLTPLSQTHSGTKWFGKPSPDRSSVGASSLVWPCDGCAFKSKSPGAIATKRLELSCHPMVRAAEASSANKFLDVVSCMYTEYGFGMRL